MTAVYDPRAGRYAGGAPFGLPPPRLPVCDAEDVRQLVRFEHPAKLLAVKELPGAALLGDECQAAAYGIAPDALARHREALRAELREAVRALLGEPGVRDAVAAFPVPAGATFVALGDSITDDLQSWAEILRACLDAVRPGEVTVVNGGISGDTTADALARLYGIVELRPALVVAMLGTNDCQRHGPHGALLVAPEASGRNAVEITRWLQDAGARVAWLTPPPVDEAALLAAVGERPLAVRDGDVVRVAERLLGSGLEAIDTRSALGRTGHLLPDGLHPSLAGQVVIARALLSYMSTQNSSGTGQP